MTHHNKPSNNTTSSTKTINNTKLVKWLNTLSEQERIFVEMELKIKPGLTVTELKSILETEKDFMFLSDCTTSDEYLSEVNFYRMLKFSASNLTKKDPIKKYNPNEKVTCSCGRTYTKTNKSRHFKTWHK